MSIGNLTSDVQSYTSKFENNPDKFTEVINYI